jgi:hypothetical protein
MAFRSKMHYGIWLVLIEYCGYYGSVVNIRTFKRIEGVVLNQRE